MAFLVHLPAMMYDYIIVCQLCRHFLKFSCNYGTSERMILFNMNFNKKSQK